MEGVSEGAKSLIARILVPDSKRITCEEIFKDPWILEESSKTPLKVDFTRMVSFSKFSKVPLNLPQLKKIAATYIATQLS
jgi:hypothetical protein